MIIVNIKNGLGNQMFQYAFAKVLEWKYNTVVYVDFMREDISLPFSSDLDVFSIEPVIEVNPDRVNVFKPFSISAYKKNRQYLRYGYYKLRRILYPQKLILESYPSIYIKDFDNLRLKRDYYFLGHWMNVDYYEVYRERLIELFQPKDSLFYEQFIVQEIQNSCYDTISLHIRRGDYLTCGFLAPLPLSFYEKAFGIIMSKVKNPYVYLFTDDPGWVHSEFKLSVPHKLITGNTGKDSYKDILLMSLCKHNIIANSSFSWWGAWLNKNTEKYVIAPKRWYASLNRDKYIQNMIPLEWFRI